MLETVTQWFTQKQDRPVHLVPISDLHSGGSTALFPHLNELPLGGWQFQHNLVTPSAKQCDMALHWDYCADATATARNGKRMIIVLNGDMVDGIHHHSLQLMTHRPEEQAEVNIWLLKRFVTRAGFDKQKGDLLYMVSGTETHTGDVEYKIGEELGAEPHDHLGAYDFLPLEINGKLFWFLHQGSGPGRGPNKGDQVRLWLKNKYWQLLEEGQRIPDYIISGHYHDPIYNTYVRPNHTMHGMILASFQLKTRFGYRIAAVEREKIGIRTIDIGISGEITTNAPLFMTMPDDTVRT